MNRENLIYILTKGTNWIIVFDLAKTVFQGHLFRAFFEGLGEDLVVLGEF